MITIILVTCFICAIMTLGGLWFANSSSQIQDQDRPRLIDSNLEVQEYATGIHRPTDLAFLGPDDLLILEQYNGTVQRIKDGKIQPKPLLDVNVGNSSERGLLGIEVVSQESGNPFVFLYYTEAQSKDGGSILGNRLYRFNLLEDANGSKLINGTLLLDLPGTPNTPTTSTIPGLEHNGGKVILGPDGNIYVTIGDVRRKTEMQNFMNGSDADGSGGILRVNLNGETVEGGILGLTHPLDKYFAYGIRNSFGIGFDPVTGYLWDTENGPNSYDEINLVKAGFNSGWQSIMGYFGNKSTPEFTPEQLLGFVSNHIINAIRNVISGNSTAVEQSLVVAREQLDNYPIYMGLNDFRGRGVYSDPEFAWKTPVGPTAIQFYNSSALGQTYLNQIFVGEVGTGRVSNFTLNNNRTGIDLHGNLSDGVADLPNETNSAVFGEGFGIVTDIEVGPDGYLYISDWNSGTVYVITPKSTTGIKSTIS